MTKRTVTSWALVGLFFAGSMLGCGSDEATTDGNVCVPTAEICDGKDNNCNGQIDENLTQECTEGGLKGEQTCTNGQWGPCVTQQPECVPSPEVCDGKDNDCDDAIDEDDDGNALQRECKDDQGLAGKQICQKGAWGPCQASCVPSAEVCDGKDNDCDGLVDEDDSGQPLKQDCSNQCGLGTEICVAGTWQQCTAPQPSTEVCDGVDNDCDGEVDEDFECAKGTQANCGTDVGVCEFGTKVCGATCQWGNCIGGVNPGTEICEGKNDEDCDGTVDNGCGCTNGEKKSCCGGTEITCTGGTWPSCPPAPVEVCNGIDDNCNDKIDEDLPVNPYQLDEDISGIDDCAHAKALTAIMEGEPAQSFTFHLYKPDGSPDRDFFLFRADENSGVDDTFGCIADGPNECYTLVIKMTSVPAGVTYDYCVYDVGFEGDTATCAKPIKKTCASSSTPNNQVTMNWAGLCSLNDNRYFYLEVFPKSGSALSCQPYKFTIEHLDNSPQEAECSF